MDILGRSNILPLMGVKGLNDLLIFLFVISNLCLIYIIGTGIQT